MGDTFITTDNKILKNNLKETLPIFCIQKSADKMVVTEDELAKSNKAGFGDAIGTTTNRITEMYDIQADYKKGSKEYLELEKRIMCGQHYQQCAIDKIKGIQSKPMPSEWYEPKSNIINVDEDGVITDTNDIVEKKEFNMSIVADKKPYFFIYIYPHLKAKYNTFIRESNNKCLSYFGCNVEVLMAKKDKNGDEEEFIRYYQIKNPVSMQNSTMNRICRRIEKEFKNVKDKIKCVDYDYSILKGDKTYSKKQFNKIEKLYKKYNQDLAEFKLNATREKLDKEQRQEQFTIRLETFRNNCRQAVMNEEELCNIVLDICYTNNKSKQFAWDMCGSQIIDNLLNKNANSYNYITKDENGEIEWLGNKFKVKTIKNK
ncbi:MAG: hypothetical protein ACRCX8_18765 [Sarcina sp.]